MARAFENAIALMVVLAFVFLAFAIAGPGPASKEQASDNFSFIRLPIMHGINHHIQNKHRCDLKYILSTRDFDCSYVDYYEGREFYFTSDPYSGNPKDLTGMVILLMVPLVVGPLVVMGYQILTAYRLPKERAQRTIEKAGAVYQKGRSKGRHR